jgi:hypothetical protein
MKLSVSLRFTRFGHSVELLGRVISSSQGLYLYTNTGKRTCTHKHQKSIPWVGFKPTISVSEPAKTVHALDRSATVTGNFNISSYLFKNRLSSVSSQETFNLYCWRATAVDRFIAWRVFSVTSNIEIQTKRSLILGDIFYVYLGKFYESFIHTEATNKQYTFNQSGYIIKETTNGLIRSISYIRSIYSIY